MRLEDLATARISRRQALRAAGVGFAGLSLASILTACGGGNGGTSGAASGQPAGFDWADQTKAGQLNFANWPFYIDKKHIQGETHYPSLERFTQETGIQVDYREIIDDYASWFGKIRPQLAGGQATGWDLIMMGYPKWFPLMIALDYLIELDDSLLPNFAKYAADTYKDPSYDPGHRHGLAYASGWTGIGYNIDLTGREITSIMDLFDPEFSGKVGMFNDAEDMPNLTLLGMGIEPSESTPDDWNKAADLLRQQRDSGILRKYYGQGYISELQSENLVLTMAWSPDIHQSNLDGYTNLRFAIPEEGALLWTDYLCIPKGAEHPLDAITFMDFIYQPEVAAMIVGWLGSISPVPAARDVIRAQGDTELADSPLAFPDAETFAKAHPYRTLTADEQQQWEDLFYGVIEGD